MKPLIRRDHVKNVQSLLRQFPVVALLGPRQVGKSTLARQIVATVRQPAWHFDLEDPDVLARFHDEMSLLRERRGFIVLDEIQRRPEIFPALRVLVDEQPDRRFLVLGSASMELMQQTSESLAGRIAYYDLSGFDLDEVGANNLDKLWLRGGFPRSYLAANDAASAVWRSNFIRTFFARDLAALGIGVPGPDMEKFWMMVTHYHGQIWNSNEIARSLAVSDSTTRKYLDILVNTFLVRRLKPWLENLSKRQVRSPKIYVNDSGLFHSILGVTTKESLDFNAKVGASFEGFCIGEITRVLGAENRNCYFWATHGGAELDLLIVDGAKRYGFEIKHSSAPTPTPSMRIALEDLKLDSLTVVFKGDDSFPMGPKMRAVGVKILRKELKSLRRR